MPRSQAGEAIRQRMREQGLTQAELARRLGRSQTWISQSLQGDSERTLRRLWVDAPDMFETLLHALAWAPEEFARQTGVSLPSASRPEPQGATLLSADLRRGTRAIPVYDLLAAGRGADGGEMSEYIDIPESWQGPHAAYLVDGDSMSPRIPDRSKVIIRCQDYASPGNIIVCYLPGEGMLVKYLRERKPDG
ncbi:MAG TPA: S24 family peptidase, partial [Trueperaceae bacterium]